MQRRHFIHQLVGRPGRLDLAVWIVRTAGDQYFTQHQAVMGIGDHQGEVRTNLGKFVELGLLVRDGNGWPHYRQVESPVWPALVQLADAIAAMAAGRAEPRLDADPPRGLLPAAGDTPATSIPRRAHRKQSG